MPISSILGIGKTDAARSGARKVVANAAEKAIKPLTEDEFSLRGNGLLTRLEGIVPYGAESRTADETEAIDKLKELVLEAEEINIVKPVNKGLLARLQSKEKSFEPSEEATAGFLL